MGFLSGMGTLTRFHVPHLPIFSLLSGACVLSFFFNISWPNNVIESFYSPSYFPHLRELLSGACVLSWMSPSSSHKPLPYSATATSESVTVEVWKWKCESESVNVWKWKWKFDIAWHSSCYWSTNINLRRFESPPYCCWWAVRTDINLYSCIFCNWKDILRESQVQ